ncbi:MAG: 30S ribosomal protein S4e [Methanocella sp. PtaU1.Bin125]|nr:MAG: 30S ribosomal protein S4e [Methanocella sp. PtaU1.Bin125]
MTGSNHIKRVAAPRTWPITRKTSKWVVKPTPGAHSEERGMPLVVVLRDLLHLADRSKEIKQILQEGKVLVDGRVRKDHRFIVGMFDTLSIPAINANYRVMIGDNGKFKLVPIKDASVKLCKIVNKTTVRDGKIQLNLHDGTTMLASNDYKTKDSILIKVPERKIDQHLNYGIGSMVFVAAGQHAGEIGKVKEIKVVRSSSPNTVIITTAAGDFETIEPYVFVIGKDAPALEGVGA